jgi:hypothetical protein
MKAWFKRNWKKIMWCIFGILSVIFVIVTIKYFLSPADRDHTANKENDFYPAKSSRGSGFKQYGEIMEYPDPLKINRMDCPKEITDEPNLFLQTGYQWQFQSNDRITIAYRSGGDKFVNVEWYPGKSGYDEFPIGTTEFYVYSDSERANLTVMVYRKKP